MELHDVLHTSKKVQKTVMESPDEAPAFPDCSIKKLKDLRKCILRKPLSAWLLFIQSRHQEQKEANSAASAEQKTLSASEQMSKLSQEWSTLSAEERAPYEAQAAASKQEYLQRKDNLSATDMATLQTLNRKLKDSRSEKRKRKAQETEEEEVVSKKARPLNAYQLYCKEQHVPLKEQFPAFTDRVRHISDQWKALSAEEKAVYTQKAAELKGDSENEEVTA